MSDLKEMLEKIEIDKQVLSTMPQNNDKNISKYIKKVEELESEYLEYQEKITKILKKRYDRLIAVSENSSINNFKSRLNAIEEVIYLLNDNQTPYEKMGLDKIIYKISKYYKENLENINEQINNAINKFENVGIKLEVNDFNYSIYVKQYMKTFFEERKKGKILSNILKSKFEEIYWKCSDIIVHIEISFRNIYILNENKINRYFEKEKIKLLKKWRKNPAEIINSYKWVQLQKEEAVLNDKKRIISSFLNYELNISNYTDDKVKSVLSKLIPEKNISDYGDIEKSLYEFLNSLYEFKNYTKFQFIIDDIKKNYNEKDKYKKAYEKIKKKIFENEKKLKKLNKKATSKGLFGKAKSVKQIPEQNQLILEIKKIYKELDENKFYYKVATCLKDDSTIYDCLYLASSYYTYLTKCIIENNKTITPEKIDEQIEILYKFVKNPNNNIITNLNITDEKDIAIIIKDRYKLLNFNIKIEDFSGKNLDGLINMLEIIITSLCLRKNKIKVEEIQEIMQIKDTLKI